MFDFLTKDDAHAIDIGQTKLANPVRLVCGLLCNVSPAIDDLPVVGINVLHPLK